MATWPKTKSFVSNGKFWKFPQIQHFYKRICSSFFFFFFFFFLKIFKKSIVFLKILLYKNDKLKMKLTKHNT